MDFECMSAHNRTSIRTPHNQQLQFSSMHTLLHHFAVNVNANEGQLHHSVVFVLFEKHHVNAKWNRFRDYRIERAPAPSLEQC